MAEGVLTDARWPQLVLDEPPCRGALLSSGANRAVAIQRFVPLTDRGKRNRSAVQGEIATVSSRRSGWDATAVAAQPGADDIQPHWAHSLRRR